MTKRCSRGSKPPGPETKRHRQVLLRGVQVFEFRCPHRIEKGDWPGAGFGGCAFSTRNQGTNTETLSFRSSNRATALQLEEMLASRRGFPSKIPLALLNKILYIRSAYGSRLP